MSNELNRRRFLQTALLSGAGLGAARLSLADDSGSPASGTKKAPAEALAAKVPRKELGATGVDIPILLLGCAQAFDPRYDKILHRCFKEGVDYLDTALVYAEGESQRTIAPFLSQVGRDNVWITTKAPHRSNGATTRTYLEDLDKCLHDLGTSRVDLFFMHGLNDVKYISKPYLKMAERLKKQGKIRFFGFSCHDGNVVELMNAAADLGGMDAIMFRYNFAKYGDRELNRAIDRCKRAGIGLIAMKTQRSVPADQENVVAFESRDFTLGQAKLKAVWADERIDSAVSHMDSLELVDENVAAAKSPVKLSMGDFHQLNRLAACTESLSCEGCSHLCESQVEGEVKIADALRFLMYHEAYGEQEKARKLYRELRPAERQLDGVDFSEAVAACPVGIDIPARLQRAREVLS